jgi:hypothetical protein
MADNYSEHERATASIYYALRCLLFSVKGAYTHTYIYIYFNFTAELYTHAKVVLDHLLTQQKMPGSTSAVNVFTLE